MSIGITKSVAAVAFLAGTGAVFSETRSSSNSGEQLSSTIQDTSIFETSKSEAISPLQGKCKIWEVILGQGSYKVTKIVREITDRDELVNDSDPANATFRAEIRDACLGKKDTRVRVEGHIYIYISRLNGRWAYSSVVQHYNWHGNGVSTQ
ncbi:hypothetical protein MHC_03010 [Mycoplasma haemocanis str. Illinois]|uniref:Uncharacterized protein n=1 Tax=Mycoplasma haemocanis (strain Illinois) TaxID=1111676 RepID=H6N742_MYCHN|nr:hypothetical protein [Mycoplasma haemocanis]AEW45464.1 hypothetical protein MHC_03010 [Mycoplasma haemocanis str. Illinois]